MGAPFGGAYAGRVDEPTVRTDCRHYSSRTVASGDLVQRCRVDAAQSMPFACPEGCLFFEPRSISGPGWQPGVGRP